MVKKFTIAITNISGKRVKLNIKFKTRSAAKDFKKNILKAKISAIRSKGKSSLTGLNPRVIKLSK